MHTPPVDSHAQRTRCLSIAADPYFPLHGVQFAQILLFTLRAALGTDFSADEELAWIHVYSLMMTVMLPIANA
jgi:hypothetical protein